MRNLNRGLMHGNSEMLVLAHLARGPSYGYQMRKDLAACSKYYFQFAFGTLYPVLRTLEKRGLATGRFVTPPKRRERRQYVITAKGLTELRERQRRWRQFSDAMERVLS